MNTKPTIYIPLKSYNKLFSYVDLVDTEITGFFDIEYDLELEGFVIGEIYLIEQEVGGADVEMEEEDISNFMLQLIDKGVEQLPRGWWHSHVNMGVFWSSTDNNTIDNDFTNESFTVSIVVNKKREMKATLVVHEPTPYGLLPNPYRVDDLTVVVRFDDAKITASLKKEVEDKVKTRTAKSLYQTTPYKGSLSLTKKKGGKILFLPKDKLAAMTRIDELNLVRTLDKESNIYVYMDEIEGDTWIDKWEVISYTDYLSIRGKDDTKGRGIITTPRTCINCGYYEGVHNSNVCDVEEYADSPQTNLLPEDEGAYYD